jgi:hypothetical protein
MTLQGLIAKGLWVVHEDPQHDLILGFRCRAALGGSGGAGCRGVGQRRRVKLATLSVENVLPLWESTFLVKGSRLVIYEGARHALVLTHRARFLRDVTAFIVASSPSRVEAVNEVSFDRACWRR